VLSYILAHPWLLSLIGLPALLAAVPLVLQKLEVQALKELFKVGDDADKRAIKAIVKALVQWAEDKYKEGAVKFDTVDTIIARTFPFLSADQRKQLIEETVRDLDAGAKTAVG
jgi:hypothetical protein